MRTYRSIGIFCLVAFAAPAFAAPIDGTWKADVKTAKPPEKPDSYMLRGGIYSCLTCAPPFTVPADGRFHEVRGNPYLDEVAIKVVDARRLEEIDRKAGKVTSKSSVAISRDGQSADFTFTTYPPGGKMVTGNGSLRRVGPIPRGAHLASGKWRTISYGGISDSGLLYTFRQEGDLLRYSSPTGASYAARIGGPQAPVKGDPGWTSVSVRRTGPGTFVENDYRNGKLITVMVMALDRSGRSMSVKVDDRLHGSQMAYTAAKQ